MAIRWREAATTAAMILALTGNGWAQAARPDVRVSGLMIGHWIIDLGPEAASNNRFELSRTYLTLSGRLSERVNGRITTDAIREDGKELEVRLKYAYASYQLPHAPVSFRFGLTQTPVIEYEEALWEHRMQGPVPTDRLTYMSSSDLGVSAEGRWGDGDQLQVTAGIYNGEGWSKGEVDSGKDFMARTTLRLATSDDAGSLGGLRLTGYGQVGSPAGGGVRQRALGMLSWRTLRWTLATQYFLARDRSDPAPGTPGTLVEGTLFNTFTVIKVPNTTALFVGRLELYDPNRDTPDDRQTRLTAGVGVKLAPELRLLGSFEHLSYQSGAPSAALDAARIRGLVTVALTF